MNKLLIFLGLLVLTFAHGHGHHEHHEKKHDEKPHHVDVVVHPHDSLIEYINSAQNLWTAGPNELFYKKDPGFSRNLMGTKRNTPDNLKLPLKVVDPTWLGAEDSLPENFDSRLAWPNCESIKEIRDQSNCGSCWAFGASEAMSDRICIASGQKLQTRISSNNLLACCSACGEGCNGGFPEAAWKYWVETGLVSGDLYNSTKGQWCQNYAFPACDHHVVGTLKPCDKGTEYPTPPCKKTCDDGFSGNYNEDLHFGASSYSLPNDEKAIMKEIMTHGPVECAFDVYSDFEMYKKGIYKHVSGEALGGHAVKMIGWGVENGVKYWTISNSWNEDWGELGTFRIVRGENHCGIESQIVAGLPKLNNVVYA